MPRIDDFAVSKKVFKKKEYRSWDGNLIETLKLKDEPETSCVDKTINTAPALPSKNTITPISIVSNAGALKKSKDDQDIEFNQGSAEVQLGFIQGSSNQGSGFIQGSIGVQSGFDQGSNEVQLESNHGSIGVQNTRENSTKNTLLVDRELVKKTIQRLGGNEKKIFFFAINLCSQKGSLSTGEIDGNDLNKIISTTRNGRETALKRLCSKGLLQREKVRCGRGGAINLLVNELIKTDALNYLNTHLAEKELLTNWSSIGVQLESRNSLYSSSNIINKNTTTDWKNKNLNLPDEWLAIDISPLEHLSFSKTQLQQLLDKNIPEAVQESINHFAYDLEHGSKKYSDPLNVFMGVLRKGNTWTAPKGYESPKIKALRLYAEKTKQENEFREKTIEDLMALEFFRWKENLSREEINNIIPEKDQSFCKENSAPWNAALKLHFKEKVLIPRLTKEGAY